VLNDKTPGSPVSFISNTCSSARLGIPFVRLCELPEDYHAKWPKHVAVEHTSKERQTVVHTVEFIVRTLSTTQKLDI
jgi:hypothetical protein